LKGEEEYGRDEDYRFKSDLLGLLQKSITLVGIINKHTLVGYSG